MSDAIAKRRLKQFQQKFGEPMVEFATHAALPVVLNSELVHLLRLNFFYASTSIGYITEAEFLLSSFCREIGEDLYEIEPAMRTVLLQRLSQQHPKRIKEIAALLWQYTTRYTPWRTREGLQRAQKLTALNFLDAQKATDWFQEVESSDEALSEDDREWFVAMKKQVSVDRTIQIPPPVASRMEIVKGDITKQNVDAIVNATDTYFSGGGSGSVDYAIHSAAGDELSKACQQLNSCTTGEAKITKGYNLLARFVIHTVGPIWQGGDSGEAEKLAQSYRSCLKLAEQHNIKTIAFPAISTGFFGFPFKQASKIAVREVSCFLIKNTSIEKVIFVLFGKDAYDYYHAELEALQQNEKNLGTTNESSKKDDIFTSDSETLNPNITSEVTMGSKQELDELLNNIVETKKGIDAVFVIDLGTGFLLHTSTTDRGRNPMLVEILAGRDNINGEALLSFSSLHGFKRAMDNFGKTSECGKFKSAIVQLTKGIVNVYVENFKTLPLAIGFVNTRHKEDSLARFIFFCERYIGDIMKKLRQLYST
jgi:O-acetyl-ADP-ribose deacetylase (regulator of RNase III)